MLKSHRFEHTLILAVVALLAVGGVARFALRYATPSAGWSLTAPFSAAAAPQGGSLASISAEHSAEVSVAANDPQLAAHIEPFTDCGEESATWEAAPLADAVPSLPARSASHATSNRIDLNRAGPAQLMTLPGIGPALAERILALRAQRGGFVYKEELLDVSGIGPARFEQLVDWVEVGPLP